MWRINLNRRSNVLFFDRGSDDLDKLSTEGYGGDNELITEGCERIGSNKEYKRFIQCGGGNRLITEGCNDEEEEVGIVSNIESTLEIG